LGGEKGYYRGTWGGKGRPKGKPGVGLRLGKGGEGTHLIGGLEKGRRVVPLLRWKKKRGESTCSYMKSLQDV